MICQYAEKIGKTENEEDKNENNTEDMFDSPIPVEEDDEDNEEKGEFQPETKNIEIVGEEEDLSAIVALILAWEHDTGRSDNHYVPADIMEDATTTFVVYAMMENLRREEIVKVKGSGKLLSKNTKFTATKNGKKNCRIMLKKIKESEKPIKVKAKK